jgi:glycerol-3-phosphate acyltransferase PlsY
MLYLAIVIFSLIGYIFGSFLFSLIFGRIFLHIDIRQIGSGNAGATNLFRAAKNHKCRHIIAILSSILDMLKGYFAILLSLVIFKYCFDLSDNES